VTSGWQSKTTSGDDEFADLANAVRMFVRNTLYDFHVEHDGKTAVAVLNDAWMQYGNDAV
jgi:hypothetical protein